MRWWQVVLVPVLASCGGAPADEARDGGTVAVPRDAGPLGVELGEGRTAFRELPREGAEIELVLGPQGGWHFDLAVRLAGADPEGLGLTYAVLDEQGAAIQYPGRVELNARRVLVSGDHLVRVGDRAVLDVRDGNTLVGRDLTASVEAISADGRRASDRRVLRVVDRER